MKKFFFSQSNKHKDSLEEHENPLEESSENHKQSFKQAADLITNMLKAFENEYPVKIYKDDKSYIAAISVLTELTANYFEVFENRNKLGLTSVVWLTKLLNNSIQRYKDIGSPGIEINHKEIHAMNISGPISLMLARYHLEFIDNFYEKYAPKPHQDTVFAKIVDIVWNQFVKKLKKDAGIEVELTKTRIKQFIQDHPKVPLYTLETNCGAVPADIQFAYVKHDSKNEIEPNIFPRMK